MKRELWWVNQRKWSANLERMRFNSGGVCDVLLFLPSLLPLPALSFAYLSRFSFNIYIYMCVCMCV